MYKNIYIYIIFKEVLEVCIKRCVLDLFVLMMMVNCCRSHFVDCFCGIAGEVEWCSGS